MCSVWHPSSSGSEAASRRGAHASLPASCPPCTLPAQTKKIQSQQGGPNNQSFPAKEMQIKTWGKICQALPRAHSEHCDSRPDMEWFNWHSRGSHTTAHTSCSSSPHLGSSLRVVCEVFAEHTYKTSADSINKVQYNQIGSI